MKRSIITLCAVFAATSASAQSLDSLLGNFQTKAKATAFDTAVESQAPGLSGITSQLSDSQKAQLLDLGLDNAGTVGQVAAGASALGAAGAATGLTMQPAQAQPTYGTAQPVYQQPAQAQPTYGTAQPVYQQPAQAQPTYGTAQPVYQQPAQAQPVYGTTQPAATAYAAPVTEVYVEPAPAPGVYSSGSVTLGQSTYQQQPLPPAYGTAPAPAPQPTGTQQLINGAVRLGIDALK